MPYAIIEFDLNFDNEQNCLWYRLQTNDEINIIDLVNQLNKLSRYFSLLCNHFIGGKDSNLSLRFHYGRDTI